MRSLGYTLIELLVVITIISLLAVVGFVNFKDFAADQVTKKAVGQVQSLLRLAQSNATSSTLCNNQGVTSWSLKFLNDAKTIELRCDTATPPDYLVRSYTLENAQVEIKGSGCSALVFPVILSYSSGVGTLTISPSDVCLANATSIVFTISNTRNPSASPKPFSVSKGGAIDVQ